MNARPMLNDHEIEELNLPDSRGLVVGEVLPAPSTAFGFDYSGVSAAIAQEAEEAAERIRNRHRASIIDTGRDLLDIKDKLGHGEFGPWLQYHFSMTERTAENYMNAARTFGSLPKG